MQVICKNFGENVLIEFKVKNYGPFRDEVLFSMVASNYDKTTFEDGNVVKIPKFDLRLLKSAAIYGSNASGKTQFINALNFVNHFVTSGGRGKNKLADIPRFRLDDVSDTMPTELSVTFLHNGKIFEYGFALGNDLVTAEWLFVWITNRRTIIFQRDINGLQKPVSKHFKVGNTIDKAKQVKGWNLYLTKAFEFEQPGNELILEVKSWFEGLRSISGNDPSGYETFTYENLVDPTTREKILEFIKNADFTLEDVIVNKFKEERILSEPENDDPRNVELYRTLQRAFELLPERTVLEVKTKYKRSKHDGSFEYVEFTHAEESEGTKKFIAIAGPVLDILSRGGILIVDELDTKLHPLLLQRIIDQFHSTLSNPNNAQLIFNSHNTTPMGQMRRDQIWFTKKDRLGVSTLDPLSNYKYGPRKEENLEERYLDGRFGGIPFLGRFGSKPDKFSTLSTTD